jgi:hypothetical protein
METVVKMRLLLITALLSLASTARAIPLNFEVTYDGSVAGIAGSGSFNYDADTTSFSNFMLSFGDSSAVVPLVNGGRAAFGGTLGQFLFEILTGMDVHPVACGVVSCSFTTSPQTALVTSASFTRNINNNPLAGYRFLDSAQDVVFAGSLSVRQVPEPATVALVGLGLLGLVLARLIRSRRRTA